MGLSAIEKKQRAQDLHRQNHQLLEKATTEKRDLTADEAAEFDRRMNEIESLYGSLGGIYQTRAEALEASWARYSGPIAGGQSATPGGHDLLSDGEVRFLRHEDRMSDHVQGDLPDGLEPDQATTGRIVRGMLTGWKGLDRERRALVGAEDPLGGYLLPEPLSTRFIDLARARMVLSQAGALTIPVEADSLKVPKLLADPTPHWRGELEEITESDPTFAAIVLRPKTVAILTLVSHEVWEDAQGLGSAVETAMSRALAHEIDRVGLVGGGAGNTAEPVGIYHTDGVQTVEMDTDGAVPTDYDDYLDAIEDLEEANAEPRYLIYSPRTKRTLTGLVTGITSDKTKLTPPADFQNLRKLTTTAIPNDLVWGSSEAVCSAAFLGGFENLWMGLRTQVRLDVSPHGSGVFNKLGLWVRAFARVDFACVRPNHLARITGIKAS